MYSKKQKIEIYTIFLLIVYAIEIALFLIVQKGALALYITENQPGWVLPLHWLIPVWFVLYTMIGIAGASIWLKRKSVIRHYALVSWVVVVVLEIIWPITFYHTPYPILAPVLISVLFIALMALLFNAFLVSRMAGYLLIPFAFMILYKLVFHWTFYILNIQFV